MMEVGLEAVMKELLTFFGFGGAAIYAVLALISSGTPDGKKAALYAVETQPPSMVRRLNSWGPYLPSPSLGQEQSASLVEQRAALPEHTRYEPSRKWEQGLGADHQVAPSADEAPTSAGDLAQRTNAPTKVVLTEPLPTKPALAKSKKGTRSAKPAGRKRFAVARSEPKLVGRTDRRRGFFIFGRFPTR